MKTNLFITMGLVVGMVSASMPGRGQLALAPIVLSGVSAIHPFTLPNPPFVVKSTSVYRVNAVCTGMCTVVLPVSLLQLQGARVNNYQVALTWKTKNEINSRGFDIERSLGDGNNFSIAGNSAPLGGNAADKTYDQTDKNSYAGISLYRVKQVDIDGNFAYSNTIQVKGYPGVEQLWVSPNPADAKTVLTCYSVNSGTGIVKMLSAKGQEMFQTKWLLNVGNNSLGLSLNGFVPGLYYIQLLWPGGHASSIKLVVK